MKSHAEKSLFGRKGKLDGQGVETINKTFRQLVYPAAKLRLHCIVVREVENNFNNAFWNNDFRLEFIITFRLPKRMNAVPYGEGLRYDKVIIQEFPILCLFAGTLKLTQEFSGESPGTDFENRAIAGTRR